MSKIVKVWLMVKPPLRKRVQCDELWQSLPANHGLRRARRRRSLFAGQDNSLRDCIQMDTAEQSDISWIADDFSEE
jgi:hypothetical protein